MKKAAMISLIVASALVAAGIIVTTIGFFLIKFDFSIFGTKTVTNTYYVENDFDTVKIDTSTLDIRLALSDDGKCRVECVEQEKRPHTVSSDGKTLSIEEFSDKKWYDYIDFGITHSKLSMTVYLPENKLSSLVIKGDTGDVTIPKDFSLDNANIKLSTGNVSFSAEISEALTVNSSTGKVNVAGISPERLELKTSTGNISVSGSSPAILKITASTGDVYIRKCSDSAVTVKTNTGDIEVDNSSFKSFSATATTGEVELEGVTVAEMTSIKTDTGDVSLEQFDSDTISIVTDTGDVEGVLLSSKIFMARSDTGKIRVPTSTEGGLCEVTTDTGDIKFTLKQ